MHCIYVGYLILLNLQFFQRLWNFFFYFYLKLKKYFNHDNQIRYFIIEDVIENSNYDFLEKIFLQFHFIKHDILVFKDKTNILFDKNSHKINNTSEGPIKSNEELSNKNYDIITYNFMKNNQTSNGNITFFSILSFYYLLFKQNYN